MFRYNVILKLKPRNEVMDDDEPEELNAHDAVVELDDLCRLYRVELRDHPVPFDCYKFGADSKRAEKLIAFLTEDYIDSLDFDE
jgi:hypothetical protein